MLFSELLKKEMKIHNLEVKDLVEITGLSYNKIYSYLNGTVPKNKDLNIVCEAIGVSVDDVVFDDLNISVTEAAKMMKKSPNFVKAMVKNGVFGFWNGNTYHIPRHKFEEYMGLRNSMQIDNVVNAMYYLLLEKIKSDDSAKSSQTN